MQRDVGPLPQAAQKEIVLRAPRPALVPAEEHEAGLGLLPGQAVEARRIAVDACRYHGLCRRHQEQRDEHTGENPYEPHAGNVYRETRNAESGRAVALP
jgi:hypothetical protein